MPSSPLRALLVEDNPGDVRLVKELLAEARQAPVCLETAGTLGAGLERLATGGLDVLLLDLGLPDSTGLETFTRAQAAAPHLPIIVLTGSNDDELAAQAVQRGAQDFLTKGLFGGRLLARTMGYAISRKTTEREIRRVASFPLENPNPVLRVALDGVLVFANQAAALLLACWGCPTGRRLPDAPRDTLRRALEAGERVQTEEDCRGRVFSLTWAPMPAAGYVNIYGQDITERKRAEQALRESEDRFRYVFDHSPIGKSITLPTGEMKLNRAFYEMLGYAEDELQDARWQEITHPDDIEACQRAVNEILAGERDSARFSKRYLHKNGSVVWADVSTTLRRDREGKPLYLVTTVSDITERKRAEEALRESEERFRAIFDNALDGILVADAAARKFLFGNRAIHQMLGYTPEELRTLGVTEIHPEKDLPRVIEVFDKQARKELGVARELPVQRKDGSVFYADVSSFPMSVGGRSCLVGVFRDCTEMRQAQARFRQAQKMEAIGQLAGGVAHDFNNLLFVMNGRAELALNRLAPDDPSRSDIEIIQKTGERAANLTRQLLAFSRQQILQPRVLDLNAVVSELHKMLLRLVRENITLTPALDPGLRPVRADPGQVEQVLMNLVVNARDAMPKGGKLTIETANVELDESYCRARADVMPGHYVMLAVSDTGQGMDESVKAHIFEPFFTTKEQGQGTGLGLATVYGIVKQSGGHITVYSEPGRGATFKVYLPQVAEAPARASRLIKTIAPRGTETVLLVEDEEEVRALACELLKAHGYKVILASNGSEGLAVLKRRKGKVDVLLTDVVMPKMGGPELAQRARKLCSGIKVLFMSGYTDGTVSSIGLLSPDRNHLQKPFTTGTLARKVREVLDKR